MAKLNFGGVREEVITRDEYPLARARKMLRNEVVTVLGYGVQGPAQALNMRDNGINVIVGQRKTDRFYWNKALKDGWKPGKTLFDIEAADQARHNRSVPGLRRRADDPLAERQAVPDGGEGALFLARLLHRLQEADEGDSAEEH